MTLDIVASVYRRLLNLARAEGRPFADVLQYYALQRFLYRLAHSAYRGVFVLKGALMLSAWQAPISRPTRDIDLLGRLNNDVEHVVHVMRQLCTKAVVDDGLRFDASSLVGRTIAQGAHSHGVQVRFTAYLGKIRIPMQIDIGFGDPLVSGPIAVELPALLNYPPADLLGYSRESAIAEKLHAMVEHGHLNSRMKDFYDIWLLATHFDFDGPPLAQAIHSTFAQRGKEVSPDVVAFDQAFLTDDKRAQWAAFMRRSSLQTPASLQEALAVIRPFLQPVLRALAAGQPFAAHWPCGGPWN